MNQQIDCSIILKLTINTIISGRKPWITIQQRTDCSVLKTDNGILCRGLIRKPQIIYGIEAILTQPVLYRVPVNCVLHSCYLQTCIGIVGKDISVGIGICFLISQTAGQHNPSRFLNQLPTVAITVDTQI